MNNQLPKLSRKQFYEGTQEFLSKSKISGIKSLRLDVNEEGIVPRLEHFQENESFRLLEGLEGAILKDEHILVGGISSKVEYYNNAIVSIKIEVNDNTRSDAQQLISRDFFLSLSRGKVDLYYRNSRGQFVAWNRRNKYNSLATEEELKDAVQLTVLNYSDSGIKEFRFLAINLDLFKDIAEYEKFLDYYTSGQYLYYKKNASKLTLGEQSELVIRSSTVNAPSVDIRKMARKNGYDKSFETVYILDKLNYRDGLAYANSTTIAALYAHAMNVELSPKTVNGYWMQARPHSSLKPNIIAVDEQAFNVLAKKNILVGDMGEGDDTDLTSPKEGLVEKDIESTIHIFKRQDVHSNPILREELQRAFDKNNHNADGDGLVKGTRFKVGDTIWMTDNDITHSDLFATTSPDLLFDMNTVKASFNPGIIESFPVMRSAKENGKAMINSSAQMTSTLYYKDPEAFSELAHKNWGDGLKKSVRAIGLAKPKIPSFDLVSGGKTENTDFSTVIKALAPQYINRYDRDEKAKIFELNVFNRFTRDVLQKGRMEVPGANLVAQPDPSREFGLSLIKDDEFFSLTIENLNKRIISVMKQVYNKKVKEYKTVGISVAKKKELKKEIKELLDNINYHVGVQEGQSGVVQYRSPKMSIYEAVSRKMISKKEIANRADEALTNSLINEENHAALISMYTSAKGIIMVRPSEVVKNIHSGMDWDTDSLSVILEKNHSEIMEGLDKEITYID